MEKEVKTTDNMNAVPTMTVPAKATVRMSSYINKAGEDKEYVSVTLHNPFDDPDFGDVEISPQWRDAKGVFEFKAKKVLKTHESFELDGCIKIRSYVNKVKRRKVTYPALLFENPFGDGEILFSIRGEDNAAVFSMLASQVFKAQLDVEAVGTAQDDDNR